MSGESSVSKGTSVSRTPSKAQDPWQKRGQKDGKSQRLERTRAKPWPLHSGTYPTAGVVARTRLIQSTSSHRAAEKLMSLRSVLVSSYSQLFTTWKNRRKWCIAQIQSVLWPRLWVHGRLSNIPSCICTTLSLALPPPVSGHKLLSTGYFEQWCDAHVNRVFLWHFDFLSFGNDSL